MGSAQLRFASGSRRRRIVGVLAGLGALALASACDSEDGGDDAGTKASRCAEETRADDFRIGLAHQGERLVVEIADAEPSMPIRSDNTWTFEVSDTAGTPMEGMSVSVVPFMPDHSHGTPVQAEVTELGEGTYVADPVNLYMAGLWEVTMTITDDEGVADEVVFRVCVE